jgi:predicted RecB family nuclease
MKVKQLSQKENISEAMFREFQQGQYSLIKDKPFLVYDIETTFDGYDFKNQHFEMAYSIQSDDEHAEDMTYRYIDRTNMKKFCDFLLDYDGWIIGYNQIGFDNPVLIKNVGYGDEELAILNKKSIDPFLVFWKLLGKRMSLDAVASILIAEGKTLSSGKEGEQLLQMYKETGQEKFLNKVKKYCKNDVRITL